MSSRQPLFEAFITTKPLVYVIPRDAGEGNTGGQVPLLPFLNGTRGSKVPFLNCFYSILATVFQPENTSKRYFMFKIDRHSPNRFTSLPIQSQYLAI